MFGAGDGLVTGEAAVRGKWSLAPPSAAAAGIQEERGASRGSNPLLRRGAVSTRP